MSASWRCIAPEISLRICIPSLLPHSTTAISPHCTEAIREDSSTTSETGIIAECSRPNIPYRSTSAQTLCAIVSANVEVVGMFATPARVSPRDAGTAIPFISFDMISEIDLNRGDCATTDALTSVPPPREYSALTFLTRSARFCRSASFAICPC